MKEQVWVVFYQVPYEKLSDQGFPRYRSVKVGFKSRAAADQFLNEEIMTQPWYDSSVCFVVGPVTVRE